MTAPTSNRKKIVVLGAGIGGLTAAHELKRAGHEVTVIEESGRAGGRMSDVDDRSFKAKFTGATRFFPFYRDLWALVDEFKLKSYVVPAPTQACVMHGEEKLAYDLRFRSSMAFQKSISWKTKFSLLTMLPDLVLSAGKIDPCFIDSAADYDDETAAEYIVRKAGKDFLENVVGVAYRNLLAWNIEESSKAFFLLFYAGLRGKPQFTFKGGIGRLPRAMAGLLDVRYSSKNVKVTYGDDFAGRNISFDGPDGLCTLDADIVVCAIPGNRVKDTVQNQADWEKQFFENIPYSQYSMMHYLLKKDPQRWHDATLMPRSMKSPISMLKTFRANPEIPGDLAKLWTVMGPDRAAHYVRPDGTNLDEVTRFFLRDIYPKLDDDIVEAHPMYEGYVNVMFPQGQARKVRTFLSIQESGPKNIYYVGDYLANGTAGGACASGVRTAKKILDHWQ